LNPRRPEADRNEDAHQDHPKSEFKCGCFQSVLF
jgi:hypothetical protein